ncbi:MAG TPA: CBS domain-containing protein [Candidatus Nanoarchaeia archaeon]|nr:CBS domain-containing protein [Candidatus Nanoarchaeia archaeon]
MAHLLSDLKQLRKKYDLTQKELSNQSGVSQSLIAKIEAGIVEPSYSKALNLFQTLEGHQNKQETKAQEIMTKKVITINKNDCLELVITLMKKHNISQIPVIENAQVCGLITENVILEKTIASSGKINLIKAGQIMIDAPPIIPPLIGLRTILELLRDSSTVLVMEKGELKGIISKSNVLGAAK